MSKIKALNYEKNHCGLNFDVIKRCWKFPDQKPDFEPNLESFMASINQEVLKNFLKQETKIVIDLGTWFGASTRYMYNAAPNAYVISIDTWFGSLEHNIKEDQIKYLKNMYETFLSTNWDFRDRIIPIRLDTFTALNMLYVADVKPDLIYIDASHSYEVVKMDFELCLDLFPESKIVGDDYSWTEVHDAVTEIAQLRNLEIKYSNPCWWVA